MEFTRSLMSNLVNTNHLQLAGPLCLVNYYSHWQL
jgi:hypothetical protein